MSQITRGQQVQVQSSFHVRCFSVTPGEDFDPDYGAFKRDGRRPLLSLLSGGETLLALTDANDNGFVYAALDVEGEPYACLLLPDSYTPL